MSMGYDGQPRGRFPMRLLIAAGMSVPEEPTPDAATAMASARLRGPSASDAVAGRMAAVNTTARGSKTPPGAQKLWNCGLPQ